MSLRSRPFVYLWLLSIALLAARVTDAHVHLCLDGGGRPVSVHVKDAPTHYGQDASTGHNDRDVDLSSPLVVKKSDSLDNEAIAVVGVYVLALILPTIDSDEPARVFESPALPSVFDLKPPLRGPPV
ncbi:MAG TPA: hypothetical protein VJS12_14845 [Steroidobacteraceae bacterium]|nr:hypothetical protein [Steroidobacteraceae bacterium]